MANRRSGSVAMGRRRSAKGKSNRFTKTNKQRLILVFCFMLLCFSVLLGRLVQINVAKGETYQQNVMAVLSYGSSDIPSKRGDIMDRNGTVLATSEKYYNLVLDCYVVNNSPNKDARDNTIKVLNDFFEIDRSVVEDKLENDPSNRYVRLKFDMTYDEKKQYDDLVNSEKEEDQIIAHSITDCFWFEEKYERLYPYSTLACDVLGFMNGDDPDEWYGLENSYNEVLSGTNGKTYGYINERVDQVIVTQEPQNGKTVYSTIDVNIQRILEKYIANFMETVGAKNVAAIAMNPKNGEILGMASAPVFNCNEPSDYSVIDLSATYTDDELNAMSDEELTTHLYEVWRNFCVMDAFEPGSTAKTMTVSYALDEAVVNDSDTYVCDGGEWYKDGTYVSCNAYHSTISLQEAITHSCNDALMKIGDALGKDSFLKMQKDFGIGQKTGIDLPFEQSCENLIFDEDNLGPIELWTSSFGQGFNVNMVQMAAAFSSIVNGGNYYKPHIVSSIQTDTGTTVQVFDKELVRTTVSEETSKWMKEALYQTVENGSGHYAQVSGYKIGGKTGTAEKLPRGGPERLVSFIGAAPIDDPELVVYVIVDEPVAEDQGQSSFASTMVGKIFAEALPYLQIFPTEALDPSRLSFDPNEMVEPETDEDGNVIENENSGGSDNEEAQIGEAQDQAVSQDGDQTGQESLPEGNGDEVTDEGNADSGDSVSGEYSQEAGEDASSGEN